MARLKSIGIHDRASVKRYRPVFADLWFLYQAVTRRKPRVLLEFGSGCSTGILAHALRQIESEALQTGGRVYSVDADRLWVEATATSIPHHLRRFCEISHRFLLEIDDERTLGFRHASVPDIIPNFVYLDGPG